MVIEKILESKDLTVAEMHIKDYILNPENDISLMTSKELGQKSFTSQASVMRFYKKLGYRRYRDFISELNIERQEYFKIADIDMSDPSQYFTSYENIQTAISRIYALAIMKTDILLNKNILTRVCNRLLRATSIDVYAIGIDECIGQQLNFKLRSLGLPSTFQTGINLQYIYSMPKNTISIVISLSGTNKYISEVIHCLKKEENTYLISLFGVKNVELAQLCDESITFYTTSQGELDVLVDLFSAEYVVNIIYAILKGKNENYLTIL